jgi:hypothetical protein
MARKFNVFLVTIICIILTYYVAILLHEWGHGTAAWLFGYKHTPFDIIYGSWYLMPVSENVDYDAIMAAKHGTRAALIGIAGPTVTLVLFLISLFMLQLKRIQKNIFSLSFFFWLANINLMEIFSYIPNRTFTTGDISRFNHGFNISPFWIFVPVTLFVIYAFFRLYGFEIIKMYAFLPIQSTWMRRLFLWLTFWILILQIVYWSRPFEYKIVAYTANILSLLFILIILIICDPANNWVKQATLNMRQIFRVRK